MVMVIYPHRFFYGGVTTFVAHLVYTHNHLPMIQKPTHRNENIHRNFGYGLKYKIFDSDSFRHLTNTHVFITMIKDEYLEHFDKLIYRNGNRATVVIHDPRDVSNRVKDKILNDGWNVITIRESVKEYLYQRFGIESKFKNHPFYPYPITTTATTTKSHAVSISRIGYGKNIDMILKSNYLLDGHNDPIDIYGCPTPIYVYKNLKDINFDLYWKGEFPREFKALGDILNNKKFVVDLSTVKNDGGGTQYTFLEAIHHGCALILNRKWIEGVDDKFRIFKEDYNCLACEDAYELAEIIHNDPDVTKIVENSQKILEECIKSNWSDVLVF